MKKMMILLALLLVCTCAYAETAKEYCKYLEAVLPDGNFTDTAVPDFCIEKLGDDYEFAARSSERYGSYIAGVRKTPVPAGAQVDSYGGSFEQRIWRVSDGSGGFLYNFALAEDVHIAAYDALAHLVISSGNYPARVFDAASDRRARLVYANEHGFDFQDESRPQLEVYLHNYESWKAGATIEPVPFYLNVEKPEALLGEKSMDRAAAYAKYRSADVGLYLKMDGETCTPVYSAEGVKGVEFRDRLHEAGPDFDRLMDIAAEALGYRPGDMDFIGKKIVKARFEWLAGKSPWDGEEYKRYGAGSVEIVDPVRLGRLYEMLEQGNYMLGNVNCPSPAFMVLEFEDGTSAEIAVAINSFSTFFYRGRCFEFTQGDIIDIFNLDETVFYKAHTGE